LDYKREGFIPFSFLFLFSSIEESFSQKSKIMIKWKKRKMK